MYRAVPFHGFWNYASLGPMQRVCKLCETSEEDFALHPDVCDDCAKYDWGHWRWRQVSFVGAVGGAFVAVLWAAGGAGGSEPAHPAASVLFIGLLGALLGWALAEVAVDRLLNRALLHAPPSEAPGERAREAEKFFYIGVLSAYQGKTRLAIRMWGLAQSHGWRGWEHLRTDPRLAPLSRSPQVRALTLSDV